MIDVSWCTEADSQTRLTPAHADSKDRSFTAERQSGAGTAGSDDNEGGEFEKLQFLFSPETRDYWRLKHTPQSGWVKL
ncbi:hypothetical protein ABIC12_004772 [Pantoea agglomerans]|jgi:hypothetical protein|uniref:hypothetical protein n=1 Tax=Enterobacter agglomerans TaxID=549 RepID=UPI0013BD332C|nr:hypothetical protein [Pantoea agglomerans]MDQ0430994.1 hypothetical protein [Pantoea agglomerans]NEG87700.1 hypothetical protein [Pantoea agglomerans]NEH06910.1 hypothetical protein [Pantoea agglomerans]